MHSAREASTLGVTEQYYCIQGDRLTGIYDLLDLVLSTDLIRSLLTLIFLIDSPYKAPLRAILS